MKRSDTQEDPDELTMCKNHDEDDQHFVLYQSKETEIEQQESLSYKDQLVSNVKERFKTVKAIYEKFAPAINVLGGFNPAGHWKKVFVQVVKKPRGQPESFGKKYKKKI